ncbi:MAG: hypothetical protein JRN21_05535 [Nitrososphaerota archaeon]|nr:hypothetical protein [Nitrososphaerota archaeon]
MRRVLTGGLMVFALSFVAFELSINTVWATDHSTSMVQLAYAFWQYHSPALGAAGGTPPGSVDDFRLTGQIYSAVAPGASFFALPFMGMAFALSGGYTAYGYPMVLSETFVALTGALAAFLVYKTAALFFRRSTSVFLGLAFALSTNSWPLATYFFQSDVSAMFVVLAAYAGVTAGRSATPGRRALACGLAAGAAFTVDYVDAVIIPILFVYLAASLARSRRPPWAGIGGYLLGASPGVLAIGLYNYSIFGTPTVFTEQGYLGGSLFGAFSTPVYAGLALDFVSLSRGLFAFAPLLVVGVLGLFDAFRRGEKRPEMLLLLSMFVGIVVPYSMWYGPTGGLAFGPRFLVAAVPLLLLPAGVIVDEVKGKKIWLLYAAFAVGAEVNGLAAQASAIAPPTPFDVSPFVAYTIPNLAAADFATLWSRVIGDSLPFALAMVAALGVVAPIVWVELARMREAGANAGVS